LQLCLKSLLHGVAPAEQFSRSVPDGNGAAPQRQAYGLFPRIAPPGCGYVSSQGCGLSGTWWF
jgi:hypothetical protein